MKKAILLLLVLSLMLTGCSMGVSQEEYDALEEELEEALEQIEALEQEQPSESEVPDTVPDTVPEDPTEAEAEHEWVLSADGSAIACSHCDATYETQELEVTDFRVSQGFNEAFGFGLNDNGTPVYWSLSIELLDFNAYDVEAVACSWDDTVIPMNGKTSVDDIYDDYGWEAAKGGQTLWRSHPNYEQKQFIAISLPDDKTIAGPQWITVIGQKAGVVYLCNIPFVLTYEGGYKTGTGWSVTESGTLLIDDTWSNGSIMVMALDDTSLWLQIVDDRPAQEYEDLGTPWGLRLEFGEPIDREYNGSKSQESPYVFELMSSAHAELKTVEYKQGNLASHYTAEGLRTLWFARTVVFDNGTFTFDPSVFIDQEIGHEGNTYTAVITFPDWFDVSAFSDLTSVGVTLYDTNFWHEMGEKGSSSAFAWYTFEP